MADSVSDVLVVGAGIGGLSVARALARQGRAVRVVELQSEWQIAGAGIVLHGPALRALAALDLLDEVEGAGFPLHVFVYLDGDSDVLATSDLPQLAGPGHAGAVGIMRAALHDLLLAGARSMGVEVTPGLTVRSLDPGPSGMTAELSDGTSVRCGLVVGADGIRSGVRRLLFGDTVKPSCTGTVVWRALLDRPETVDRFHVFNGGTVVCGLCPVSDERMYMFAVEVAPELHVMEPAAEPEGMRKLLQGFTGLAGEVREQIEDPRQVVRRPVESVLKPLPWHAAGTVLIGDAVHAPPPTLAAGGAIVLEDAVVLAQMLGEDGYGDGVLEAFGRRRWDRCRLVVENSLRRNEALIEGRDFDTADFERAVWMELAKPA